MNDNIIKRWLSPKDVAEEYGIAVNAQCNIV